MPELQTTTLPLMPLTTGVILPGMVVTLTADTDEAKAAVAAAERGDGRLLLVPFIDGTYARTGTIGKIENAGDLPGGIRGLIIRGIERATVGAGVATGGTALLVQADPIAVPPFGPRAHELAREYRAIVETIFDKKGVSHLNDHLRGISDPGQMADTAGYAPELTIEQKVEVLETVDVEQRLEKVLAWMHDVLADITLKERIHNDVNEGMEKTQREFILRQQLAAIRKELGDSGDDEDVIEEYRAKVAGENVPEHVRKAVDKELGRLERTSEQNPEHGWIRGWLDTVTELPWGTKSDDQLDVSDARVILDADHTGLNDVKDRIVEYLAVRKLRADRGLGAVVGRSSGAIIALVGPPGVGKTSLGESVARALGRKFVRVSLGGVADEAEIRGHRRTYVGAQPGRIVRALREAGTMNPVFLLDEVDKLGSDWRGNPSSALLEVLDPAQNHTFRDHYLEIDLDLSDVLFIATANQLDTIPGPLLDRMEIIPLDGYTDDEKVTIARDHLLARQLERNGMATDEVVTDDALRSIVSGYTREAGVRNLERELGKTLRKVATKVAGGDLQPPVVIDEGDVNDVARPAEVLLRGRRPHRGARRGHRPGRHRHGRRRPLHRGDGAAVGRGRPRRRGADHHRPAGRRHEGVGPDRPVLRAVARRRPRDPVGRPGAPPRARRRHPQGRPVGRRHHGLGPGQPHVRPPAAVERGDDRRGHPAGTGPAHRRGQAEGAGRVPGRAEGGHPPDAQRARPRRRPPGGQGRHDLPPGRRRHRGAGAGARAGPRRGHTVAAA